MVTTNKQSEVETSAALVLRSAAFQFIISSMAPVTDRAAGATIAAISVSVVLFSYLFIKHHPKDRSTKNTKPFSLSKRSPKNGVVGAIGNTPLIRINSLSEATGCEATSHFSIFLCFQISCSSYGFLVPDNLFPILSACVMYRVLSVVLMFSLDF